MGRNLIFTLLILCSLSLIGCGSKGDLIVAKVAGKKITLKDMEGASAKLPSLQEKKEQLLRTLIDKELLILEAESRNLDRSSRIIRELENLKREKMLEEFRARLSKGINVSEEKMRQYYHQSGLDSRTETKASHIMVWTREEAEEILESLKAGADFAELARERSLDTASAQKGGDLGYWEEGVVAGATARKIFSMEPGEISEPFQSKGGWHIFKVVDRRPVGFKKQKPMIEKRLRREKLREKEREYMEGLKNKSNLKIDKQGLALLLEKGKDSIDNLPQLSTQDQAKTLFSYRDGRITLGDYLIWLESLRSRRRPEPCDSARVVGFAEATATNSVLLPGALHKAGIDQAEQVLSYLAQQREKLMVEELKRQEIDEKVITPEAIREYYQEHLDDYSEPEMITVQSTLLDYRANAQELFNQVKKGADMEQVAQNYPLFSQTFKSYILYSFYVSEESKERLGRAYVEEAARTKIGELKGPIKVSFERRREQYTGYNVFRVLEKKKPGWKPLDNPKVLQNVVIKLRIEKREEMEDLFAKFVSQLREEYSDQITRYEESLKFL
jgi:parvulin-like peptidyl-prolyl isomerase